MQKNFFTDEKLQDIFNELEMRVAITDVSKDKIIQANDYLAAALNSSAADMDGLSTYELVSIFSGDQAAKDQADKFIKQNQQVVSTRKSFIEETSILRSSGVLDITSRRKMLLADKRIITITQDIVLKTPLDKLWTLYQFHYPANFKLGIQKFLAHTGVLHYFDKLPTPAELDLLITNVMYHRPETKRVAAILGKTTSTIDAQKSAIRLKLKSKMSLHDLYENMYVRDYGIISAN